MVATDKRLVPLSSVENGHQLNGVLDRRVAAMGAPTKDP
jgi:hypothetical protein